MEMDSMDDRYSNPRYFGPQDQYQVGSARSGGDQYSSARDYAATGEYDRQRGGRDNDWDRDRATRDWDSPRQDRGYQGGSYQGGGYDRSNYGSDRGYEQRDRGYAAQGQRDRGQRYGNQDRGFFDRAGDEVRSWFGDEDAERRRERDQRYDAQSGRNERGASHHDEHYSNWRRSRIAELDNDYDEYRRENAQRFESEFNSWRTDRQGQRTSLGQVSEHMEVVGSDGSHVGTVDKVRGDRIILTKNDADAGGHHHSIPSRWIQSVEDKVTLRKTADEAKAAWKDEERSGAMFGGEQGGDQRGQGQDWSTGHNLNRSFSGTY
jgi:hypothetical protein